jgi:hypothetical protein
MNRPDGLLTRGTQQPGGAHRIRRLSARMAISLCAAALLVGLVSSPVLGADPNADGSATASANGTGISVAGGADSAVAPALVQQKYAQLQAYVRSGGLPTRAAKSGAASSQAQAMAARAVISPLYATSRYLSWYPGFHQKTTYYCLVATVQSIAYFDLESQWYYGLGTGSILGAQNKIYNGYYDPDGHYNPGIISSAPPGASDAKAIAWMNTQFSRYGYSFYYVAVTPSSQGAFMAEIRFDVSDYEAAYVRVDLSTPSGTGYMWYQASGPRGHILHATLAVGYDDSAGTVRSYDPFTHTTSSGCSTYYSSSYDWACNWTITQTRYWRGMDRTVGIPLWF